MKSVNVGFDLVPALLSEQVDAAIGTYFNIEGIHIESQTGEAPVIVKMAELGVPQYDELIIVANRERLQSDDAYADAVTRFLAATVAATKAAQADEAGSIESMKANTEYTDEEIGAMVPDTLPLLSSAQGLETGCFDLEAWATFGEWMTSNDLWKRRSTRPRSRRTITCRAADIDGRRGGTGLPAARCTRRRQRPMQIDSHSHILSLAADPEFTLEYGREGPCASSARWGSCPRTACRTRTTGRRAATPGAGGR